MKTSFILSLWLFFAVQNSVAQQTTTTDADAFYKTAMETINPRHIAWIRNTAADANVKKLSAAALHDSALAYAKKISKTANEADALDLLVQQAAKASVYKDIAGLTQKMDATRNQKDGLDNILAWVKQKKEQKITLSKAQLDSVAQRTALSQPKTIAKNKTKEKDKSDTLVLNENSKLAPLLATANNQDDDHIAAETKTLTVSNAGELEADLEKKRAAVGELNEFARLDLENAQERVKNYDEAINKLMQKIKGNSTMIISNLK